MNDYFEQARINMVKSQIMPNGVNDEKLLNAFFEVPRQDFVEGEWKNIAYFDGRIPLTENRTLLNPETQAKMINALNLMGGEKVLDIACGNGYSTAILSKLAYQVVGVESISSLARKAATKLSYYNENVSIKEGELLRGAVENGPYDAILINGALNEVPKNLLNQLADNGKLVTILKINSNMCKAVLMQNFGSSFGTTELFDCFANLL